MINQNQVEKSSEPEESKHTSHDHSHEGHDH